ncbi:hypothetical protein A45J_0888 [hot springs metagenome]|uniref:Polymerase beta nucleotidyltransferase domain-containing protein n=1 Tax=hot springs metagenome TaxID=433727 RepID=A0A5J4KYX7_9ZZZZ
MVDNPLYPNYDTLMENTEVRSFCEENNIELLVFFGSHASGEIHHESDINVAVKLKEGSIRGFKARIDLQT